ncbi:MAG: hypothetical protein IJT65_01940 [Eubacterium sp.]|nr:hypothetical protein [Eubacterium sp.]
MKKLLSLLLVIILLFSFSVTAFAASPYDLPEINLSSGGKNNGTDNNENGSTNTDNNQSTNTENKQVVTAKPKPAAVKKVTVKATTLKKLKKGKGALTVIWNKKSGVSGYQIQYSTNAKFKKDQKTVTVKGAKKNKKVIKGIKNKKKYYVRIRTYKTVNKKNYYSKWSKAKSIKK